jgi:predicted Fe-Mo cluster-binding NifX family protein
MAPLRPVPGRADNWLLFWEISMKIVVTSQGTNMQSPVDPRFGRAASFIVFDTETGAWSAVSNSINANAAQGAGIQASKRVVELGAEALLTGHVGPKAFAALRAGGVAIHTGASGTVADAVEQFKTGKLKVADSSDVEGHW